MNIFRVEDAYTQALEANPFLAKLNKIIDWEIFRKIIEGSYSPTEHNCGRPSYDRILMGKIIILQRLYNVSDEQMEKKGICDIRVKIFLGLDLSEKMPDEKTIWAFKEHLSTSDIVKKLFRKFDEQIATMGVRVSNGQIVDASFVEVPKQRNSREENSDRHYTNTEYGWAV